MNKSDIHSFDKDLPTFSTEEPKNFIEIKKLPPIDFITSHLVTVM